MKPSKGQPWRLSPPRPHVPRGINLEVAVMGFFAVWGGFWWVRATQWPLAAGLFPMVLAVPFTLLSSVQFVLAIISERRRGSSATQEMQSAHGPEPPTLELDPTEMRHLIGALLAFVVAIILFGFIVGLVLGVFGYLYKEGKIGWRLSAALAAFSLTYLYLLTEVVLHMFFPKPLVLEIIGFFIG